MEKVKQILFNGEKVLRVRINGKIKWEVESGPPILNTLSFQLGQIDLNTNIVKIEKNTWGMLESNTWGDLETKTWLELEQGEL